MLEKLLVTVIVIAIVGVLGFSAIRYLEGYNYLQIFEVGQPGLELPDQNSFPTEPVNFAVMRFLAARWGDDPSNLQIMAIHSLAPQDLNITSFEEAILDTVNLDSARIVVINDDSMQHFADNAIDHIENAYLINEFVPTTVQEKNLAHQFYYAAPPGLLITRSFAAITRFDVSSDGNGSIEALSSQGEIAIPVKFGWVLKRAAF